MRPSRDSVNMAMARAVSQRSTCNRAQVGAVIVRNGRVISTGYGGAPSGLPHCDEVGCLEKDGHCVRTSHAEAGAIAFAARHGIPTEGATMYVTHRPCLACAKLIINAGIREVVYEEAYGEIDGVDLLVEAEVMCWKLLAKIADSGKPPKA